MTDNKEIKKFKSKSNKLWYWYIPGFFHYKSKRTIKKLKNVEYYSDEKSKVFVGGRWVNIPRKQMAYGDPGIMYSFNQISVAAKIWPKWLKRIRDQIVNFMIEHKILKDIDPSLSYCLVNYYENGNNYIGWHHDSTTGMNIINKEQFIVSVSFGESRDFILRRADDFNKKCKINLCDGDLLIIRGKTNKYWQHSVPKRLKIKDKRWNLTFRFLEITE